ncbi:hypothetical protein [Intrasporangium sp.]|uniref:hypothetical protein n=1 Tax=Intrasporangium sp. TaxID=1925024 RepID=UPI00293AE591|nr:hypothetical protein [Intrasporangium sp.]MDV3223408.1 hypothetical protein [Intrasporangium sp.]
MGHRPQPGAVGAGRPARFDDEFDGSTSIPNGEMLYVNIQASAGLTFRIWGPWHEHGV